MQKKRYNEWYFNNDLDELIDEIKFVYFTYIKHIKDIYDTPEIEANKYVDHLIQNPQNLSSIHQEDEPIEIQSKGQQKYYFVMNMKYRNLALYIDLIYQMLEQYFLSFCKYQIENSYFTDLQTKKLDYLPNCFDLFLNEFDVDVKRFDKYEKIYELELLQNVLKHSEGRSKNKLIKLRPDFFIKKNEVFNIYKNTIIDPTLNITDDTLKEYVVAIEIFLKQFPEKLVHEFMVEQ